jgi:hypothetical protein
MVLKYAAEQPNDPFLLLFNRFLLQHLLEILDAVYLLTFNFRKFDLCQWVFNYLLRHITSHSRLAEEINEWILLKKLIQYIFLERTYACFDLFDESHQINIFKIGLEGLISLSDGSDYRIELFGVDELMPINFLLMVVIGAASKANCGIFSAGSLTAKLMDDTIVWITK